MASSEYTRFATGSVQQGLVVLNAPLDFEDFNSRSGLRYNADFDKEYVVPYPGGPPMPGQSPNMRMDGLMGEIAFMAIGREPTAQQEPQFITSFTDTPVPRTELLKYNDPSLSEAEKARLVLEDMYMPVGLVQHDTPFVQGLQRMQDRGTISVGGIMDFIHRGSKYIPFFALLVARVPGPQDARGGADQDAPGDKAVGVFEPLDPAEMMPGPRQLALQYGLNTAAEAKARGEPTRHNDPTHYSNHMLDLMQLCFFLGATAQREAAARAAAAGGTVTVDPAKLAGIARLTPTDLASGVYTVTSSPAGAPAPREYGSWSGTTVPQYLLRCALGLSYEQIVSDSVMRTWPVDVRLMLLNACADAMASLGENLRKLARRVLGYSVRPVSPGFRGTMLMRMGL